MVKFGQSLAKEYHINFAHARTSTEVALSLGKGHRRRLRKNIRSRVPYVFRPFIRADDVTFHISPDTGHVRLSLRNGEWVGFDVKLSQYHSEIMASGRIKQLILTQTKVVLVIEKEIPEPYAPTSLLALDTNERSLDGVWLSSEGVIPVSVPYPDVSSIQNRYFVRRRRHGRKKSRDRRVWHMLASKEGRREHSRVRQRLDLISKGLVASTAIEHAALALEDLRLPKGGGRGRRMRRRLSIWPQRELHRQIEYKAEERGVPIIKVDPRYTSKTCPRCGEIKERRSRVGRVFVCDRCGWRLDRQLNAGLNICRTALAEPPEGAVMRGLGGLRLDPDALADDAMILLYAPGSAGAHGVSGRSGSIRRVDFTNLLARSAKPVRQVRPCLGRCGEHPRTPRRS
ncbi:MAG: RNA-guided endonuclease TnpB family protein [Methanomassiliicoccales archaeon]|nr:RNA-guided endonuclease TnpB family protein [Methanomassiliicoccales archaeon]